MSLLDTFIGWLAPHVCLVCAQEGSLLCSACQKTITVLPSTCFSCQKATTNYQTCPDCKKQSQLKAVWRVAPYSGLAKELVWRLKFTGAQQAARVMAQAFAALYQPPATTIVVPLPTATSRVRQRGYDQAALLARNYSKLTGLSCLPCLARVGQQHQRGASRQQRLEQLQRAYRVKRRFSLAGASVLLVDDVTTTGASLRAAADTLLRAGATQVSAIVFAQA